MTWKLKANHIWHYTIRVNLYHELQILYNVKLPVTSNNDISQQMYYLFLVAKQVINNTAIWLDDDVCVYF